MKINIDQGGIRDLLALPFTVLGFLLICVAFMIGNKYTLYKILDIFEEVSKD